MGTHPIFESDFDCLTDLNDDVMRIVPSEIIEFLGDPDEIRSATLKVTNTEDESFHAKIRTTGPKFYSIRPNGIRIDPGETTVFKISLHPGLYKLNGHKFNLTVSSSDENKNELSKVFKFQSIIHDPIKHPDQTGDFQAQKN